MTCKICNTPTSAVFMKKVLGKFDVKYFKCNICKFIQTEEPFWLEEAYSNGAIGAMDVGIVQRNLILAKRTAFILEQIFKSEARNKKFIDFGGGVGLFVRLMRDKGYNFYRQDKYAKNIFARMFDIEDLTDKNFDCLTAFEVFEHLPNPLQELKTMLSFSDTILFSTNLQPNDQDLSNWWYLVPQGGQHIAFYHYKTFEYISKKFTLNFYSNGHNLHILSREKKKISFRKKNIILTLINKVIDIAQPSPPSLVQNDFEFVKSKINAH